VVTDGQKSPRKKGTSEAKASGKKAYGDGSFVETNRVAVLACRWG
jgi:hypothetical protein